MAKQCFKGEFVTAKQEDKTKDDVWPGSAEAESAAGAGTCAKEALKMQLDSSGGGDENHFFIYATS